MDGDDAWLAWARKTLLAASADSDKKVDYITFREALGIKHSFFVKRFFDCLIRDGSGQIRVQSLIDDITRLTSGTVAEKLRFLFDIYDVDGNGTIDMEEMKTVLYSCISESSIKLSDETLDTMTVMLFESADEDCNGEVTFEELKRTLENHPEILEHLTVDASNWLKSPEYKKPRTKDAEPSASLFQHYMRNRVLVNFIIVYFIINIGLFVLSAVLYRHSNTYIIIARGFGMGLNFNSAFIIVLVLRNCISVLRNTKLAFCVPFDHFIDLHKMVGGVIVVQSIGHTLAHFGNLYVVINAAPASDLNSTVTAAPALGWVDYLFTLRSGFGFIPGFAWLSGIILTVVLTIMVLLSLPCVRRSGHFQVFFWSHMLYVVYWAFCLMHGPIFWYFFIVPGFIFLVEHIYRTRVSTVVRYGKLFITEAHLLPSKVTLLVIERPQSFHYQPGDYVFIKIPAIAEYEWHPFTISSAPEMNGQFWLHIRSAGDWTSKLYDYFDAFEEPSSKTQVGPAPTRVDVDPVLRRINSARASSFKGVGGKPRRRTVYHSIKRKPAVEGESNSAFVDIENGNARAKKALSKTVSNKSERSVTMVHSKEVHVQLYVDGPYGTPTREIFDTEHAVLVGAGIGVTPFASILQSIMHRYLAMKRKCTKCQHSWFDDIPQEVMTLKKVDFFWVNRDQKCFEWFVSLLASLELMQQEEGYLGRFLDMHMYMTSALNKHDIKGVSLQMALELFNSNLSRDVITGLKTRTEPGRPDWDKVFQKISLERIGKVKVFVCGPAAMANTIEKFSEKYHFGFRQEHF